MKETKIVNKKIAGEIILLVIIGHTLRHFYGGSVTVC